MGDDLHLDPVTLTGQCPFGREASIGIDPIASVPPAQPSMVARLNCLDLFPRAGRLFVCGQSEADALRLRSCFLSSVALHLA